MSVEKLIPSTLERLILYFDSSFLSVRGEQFRGSRTAKTYRTRKPNAVGTTRLSSWKNNYSLLLLNYISYSMLTCHAKHCKESFTKVATGNLRLKLAAY